VDCKYFKCITITTVIAGLIVFVISSILNKFFYATVLELSKYFAFATVVVLFGLLVWLGVETFFFVREKIHKHYEQKRQELEAEYNTKRQEKEQELQQLQKQIERYAKTKEDFDEIAKSVYILFNDLLSECEHFITYKYTLIDVLRNKKGKYLDVAVQKGTISPKGAEKAKKRFERILDELKLKIEKEYDLYSKFVLDGNELLQKIEKIKDNYKT